jgi:cytochrome P450
MSEETAALPIPLGGGRLGHEYDQLRERGGVHRVALPDGSHAWLVTGYDQVSRALADPELSLDKRHAHGWSGFSLPPALDANLLNMDPPDHTRIRRLVAQAFTPRRVEALRPEVQRVADTLLDAVAVGNEADLIAAYAAPLPVTVMSDLLGIPAADRDDFRAWTDAMLATYPPDRDAMVKAIAAMHGFVGDLVEARRRFPGDDLLSGLLAARDQDDRLSENELTSLVFLILFAGYENSINLIANTVLLLLSHADIRGGSTFHAEQVPAAIEEAMRLFPPAPLAIRRFPTRDVTIDEASIPAGVTVLLSLASANRDPAAFPDPTRVDLGRDGNAHLSLGRGIHYCLGAPLARMQARVAVDTLVRRLPRLALAKPAQDLPWRPSFRTLGLVELPVTW